MAVAAFVYHLGGYQGERRPGVFVFVDFSVW